MQQVHGALQRALPSGRITTYDIRVHIPEMIRELPLRNIIILLPRYSTDFVRADIGSIYEHTPEEMLLYPGLRK